MKILQVRKLNKSFGGLTVIKDLDFEVDKEDIFGIAGPNGAGKTTLFNLITGFHRGQGDIIFENKNIDGLKPHQICHRGIARTFQVPQLFMSLTTFENVTVGAHFGVENGCDEKKNAREALKIVGLEGKEDAAATSLNIFDKKMTMLAAALATKPKLLLLDEPVGGLSPTEAKQSIAIFKKINKQLGVTIVIIEHLMKVLAELCSQLMIIHNGEKICIGSPQEVSEHKRVIEVYLGGRLNA